MSKKMNNEEKEQDCNNVEEHGGAGDSNSIEDENCPAQEGQQEEQEEQQEAGTQEPEQEQEQGQEPSKDAELSRLKEELKVEKAKVNEYYNRLTRLQADFDNYRRRTQKEKEEIREYAVESLVNALLPVMDNFRRALDAPPGDNEKFQEGVKMIYRQLEQVLEDEGLKAIPAEGEEFDPNQHEAVMQEETDQYPDNTVIEEMRKGYFFRDKLLRPAMVKVARSS